MVQQQHLILLVFIMMLLWLSVILLVSVTFISFKHTAFENRLT